MNIFLSLQKRKNKCVRPLIKNVYKRRGAGGNNCYVLSIAVSFNRTAVTIIRSSLLGIVSS